MLPIYIKGKDLFNPKTNEFIPVKSTTLKLEHSLVSISKWESKWKVPFLTDKEKTNEQLMDYIRCMSISGDIDPNVLKLITAEDKQRITDYIETKMTATWFTKIDSNSEISVMGVFNGFRFLVSYRDTCPLLFTDFYRGGSCT